MHKYHYSHFREANGWYAQVLIMPEEYLVRGHLYMTKGDAEYAVRRWKAEFGSVPTEQAVEAAKAKAERE